MRIASVLVLLAFAAGAAWQGVREWRTRIWERQVTTAEIRANGQLLPDWIQAAPNETELRDLSTFDVELFARGQALIARNLPEGAPARAHSKMAVDAWRTAALQRPAWPYVWAQLAEAKARSGAFDREFRHAFRNALRLGRAEGRVLRQLYRIVLLHDARMGDSMLADQRQVVQLLARREPALLIQQTSRYHRLGWLCTDVFAAEAPRQECAQRGYPEIPVEEAR